MLLKCNSYLTLIAHSKLLLSPSTIFHTRKTTQFNQKNDPFKSITRPRSSTVNLESTHFNNSYLTDSLISNLLKIAAKRGFPEGKQIHTHVIKLGFCNLLALENQLLHVYVKCKEVSDACKLFDEMPVRNVVTWNTLICGVADCSGRLKSILHLGFHYFRRMALQRVSPDYITFTSLLHTSVELDDIEIGGQLHCVVVKSGWCVDRFVNSALVDLYAKFGLVEDAVRAFDCVLKRDVVLWNVMVSCYVLNGLGEQAFGVFKLMRLEGIKGDNFTFTSLLNACAVLGSCELGRQIHSLVIKQCFDLDVVVASSLVDMYAKNENIFNARKAFDEMNSTNVISWNTMIVGYGRNNDGKEAIILLQQMLQENFGPDELTLACVISSCGNSSLLCETVQVHAYAIKNGSSTFLSVGNALINSYSKCGTIACAFQSFSSILEPDLVSWTSMIGAYAFHGLSKHGIELFETMLSSGGLRPDRVAFLGVISACSHGGLVSEGLYYFNLMTDNYHIVPNSEHYACLVDLLGRGGLLKEALDVLVSMPMGPGSDALGAFIGACKVHGNVEMAKWATNKLSELEPHKSVNYTLISNIYASRGSWFDVARVRKVMRDNGSYKVPGSSQIV